MTTTQYRTGMRMSLDEFLSLDETDGKWELDDGVLYIMPSGTRDHQFLIFHFSVHLNSYLDEFYEPPAHFYHEMTTILSRELRRAPEPDIVIVREGRSGVLQGRWVEGAPDIVIEILSTDRSRDLVRKRRIYAEAGRSGILADRPPQRHRNRSSNCRAVNTWSGQFWIPATH